MPKKLLPAIAIAGGLIVLLVLVVILHVAGPVTHPKPSTESKDSKVAEESVTQHSPVLPLNTPLGPETTSRPFATMDTGWLDTVQGHCVTEPTLFVIRSHDELVALRDMGICTVLHPDSSRPNVPELDFDKDIVIALVDVREPSSGYSIRVDQLEETPQCVTVRATKSTPSPDCCYCAVITYPCCLITTAKTDKPFVLSLTEA